MMSILAWRGTAPCFLKALFWADPFGGGIYLGTFVTT